MAFIPNAVGEVDKLSEAINAIMPGADLPRPWLTSSSRHPKADSIGLEIVEGSSLVALAL